MLLAKQAQQCDAKGPPGTKLTNIGVKMIINESDATDIQADIEGPVGTPYEGGVFRCKLAV
jgi:ubiquitin-protein ligase